MRKHSQSKRTGSRRKRTPIPTPSDVTPFGFRAAWDQLLGGNPIPTLGRRRGRKPRVPLTQLFSARAGSAR